MASLVLLPQCRHIQSACHVVLCIYHLQCAMPIYMDAGVSSSFRSFSDVVCACKSRLLLWPKADDTYIHARCRCRRRRCPLVTNKRSGEADKVIRPMMLRARLSRETLGLKGRRHQSLFVGTLVDSVSFRTETRKSDFNRDSNSRHQSYADVLNLSLVMCCGNDYNWGHCTFRLSVRGKLLQ